MNKDNDSVKVSSLLKGGLAENIRKEKESRQVSYSTIMKDALKERYKKS